MMDFPLKNQKSKKPVWYTAVCSSAVFVLFRMNSGPCLETMKNDLCTITAMDSGVCRFLGLTKHGNRTYTSNPHYHFGVPRVSLRVSCGSHIVLQLHFLSFLTDF